MATAWWENRAWRKAGLAALEQAEPRRAQLRGGGALPARAGGDLPLAARRYADAARVASTLAERDHLTRQTARLNDLPRA